MRFDREFCQGMVVAGEPDGCRVADVIDGLDGVARLGDAEALAVENFLVTEGV